MEKQNIETRIPYRCSDYSAPETPARRLQRCGGCQLVAYCSRECQKDDRRDHKPICKEFPVVNGVNVLHKTGPWEDHLVNLRERASRLPGDYVYQLFDDPKVCYTCRESRPDRLTMCNCTYVCYCSKKCARADKWHNKMCSKLSIFGEKLSLERMRISYPMTLWSSLALAYDENHMEGIAKLRVHIVTNSAYFDESAWHILFHQVDLPNLKELELHFIIQDTTYNQSINCGGASSQQGCEFCQVQDKKDHKIVYVVHQMKYHMFFSSVEYEAEPDVVIVYGITGTSSDIHSEISYRNMTYSQDSMLVLTDSTEELLIQGSRAVNAARPVNELVPPVRNRVRAFGSNLFGSKYDEAAINEKYYLTCLQRK